MQYKVPCFFIFFLIRSPEPGIFTAKLAASGENSYLRPPKEPYDPNMTPERRIRKVVRPLILLAIFAAAWTGKTFDLHTSEFYRAQRIETLGDLGGQHPAREQVCAYCPICHFHLYYFEQASAPQPFTPETCVLGDAPRLPLRRIAVAAPDRQSLRAPPHLG